MKRITGKQLAEHKAFFDAAAKSAQMATCQRAKCGSVIVSNGEVIGIGSNCPPLDDDSQRMCGKSWDHTKKPKYDLTCCVHAEWRAVIDACKRNADKVDGATLYFMRVDKKAKFTDAGPPFCTTCSRLSMEAGIKQFALWNNGGADLYEIAEYNWESYGYHA